MTRANNVLLSHFDEGYHSFALRTTRGDRVLPATLTEPCRVPVFEAIVL